MKAGLNGKKFVVDAGGRKGLTVVGAFEGKLTPTAKDHDPGILKDVMKNEDFDGELKRTYFARDGKNKFVLVGLGKKDDFDLEKLRKASAASSKFLRSFGVDSFSTTLHYEHDDLTKGARAVTESVMLSLYQFNKYKTVDTDKIKEVKSVRLVSKSGDSKKIEKGIKTGVILSECKNHVRDMVNTPGSDMTPTKLASEAEKVSKAQKIKIKTRGEKWIKKNKMNALIAVGQGSLEEPKFVLMDYSPKNAKKTIALVGKGITFDSGGINLKPSNYINSMKADMAGAAAVIGCMEAVARLKLQFRVIGVVPACENMPSGTAYRPDDIVRTYSGKTVEVINTDAEGRMILADALAYVNKKLDPDVTIDFATLTGACVVALGYEAAGMMGTDEDTMKRLEDAGNKTYERVWKLPLWDEYKEQMKGEISDIRNTQKSKGSGVITAGAFLSNFIEKPWVHLDIAGTAFLEEGRDYEPKAATGYGVRLIAQMLMDMG